MGLVLFRNPGKIAEIHRNLFTEVLNRFTDCLRPEVAALLVQPDLGFEDYCKAWAEQFRAPNPWALGCWRR